MLPALLVRLSVDVQKAITFPPWHVTRQLSSPSAGGGESGQRVGRNAAFDRGREKMKPSVSPAGSTEGRKSRSALLSAVFPKQRRHPRLEDLIKAGRSRQNRSRRSDLATAQAFNPKPLLSSQRLRPPVPDACGPGALVAPICFHAATTRCWRPKPS